MGIRRTCAEFGADRDKELLEVFDLMLAESDGSGTLASLIAQVPKQPASRFYVSEIRAHRVLMKRRHGEARGTATPSRRRLYNDLQKRVDQLMEADPTMGMADAVVQAVNSPAPEFYIEPSTARVTLYALLKRRRAEGRARLLANRKMSNVR